MMLLRTMTPQVIALDEISAEPDVRTAELAANCGTAIVATMHAASYREAAARPLFAPLAERRLFQYAVEITMEAGRRAYHMEKLS